ncbi:MAG: hypothetical protein V1645_02565 [archaeon]
MVISLDSIINEASNFISYEFNLKTEKSQCKIYSEEEWLEFYHINKDTLPNLKKEHPGVYVPQSYKAYLCENSTTLTTNLFHEFFGHGLFCEHSRIGKDLVGILQKSQDPNEFLYGEVNPNIQPLGLTKHNVWNYEGFAMWLEEMLCKGTGNYGTWEEKRRNFLQHYQSLIDYFREQEQRLTRFGFMSQLGFPKFYDGNKVVGIIKHLYDGHFKDVNFIILYGSQKPDKDIDLFIVSDDKSQNYFNGWLDIFHINKDELEELVKKFNISTTDPLFSGTLIYGDINHFERLKQKIEQQPISEEAINHNLARAEKQKKSLSYYENMPREKKSCLSYIKSYSVNAEQLSKGNKVLTLKKVLQISPN